MSTPLSAQILGIDEQRLVAVPGLDCLVHEAVQMPLLQLAEKAGTAGYQLAVASSFRSFARQLLIWNNKANGLRPVLDEWGQPLDMETWSDEAKLFAILRWSALPGASRHHWGTDLDVFDLAHLPDGYQLQLTREETEGDGPFAAFHQWLTQLLQDEDIGFYRPYVDGVGSIAPEPWHLSYAPVAREYAQAFSVNMLREQLLTTDIALKMAILDNLDFIVASYVTPYQ